MEKVEIGHLFLCYFRYFDKRFTEMFLEKSSTNRMKFVQITDFDWWPWLKEKRLKEKKNIQKQ